MLQMNLLLRRCMWTCLAVLTASPALSLAWVDTGHEIIASITYDELTPATRSAAVELLKQHPRYEKDLLLGMPEGFDLDRYAFMIASTWPDIVRSQTHPMHFVANHPAWHYIDIPIVEPGFTAPTTSSAPATRPSDPANILEALDKVSAELRDPSVAAPERAIALCWLLHLVGDLHQPLHSTSFFSAQYPEGDHGGNLAMVLRTPSQFYSQVNLHLLWDQMLGTYRAPEMIGYVAAGLHNDPRFAREKLGPQVTMHDFAEWAKESNALAGTAVYLNGQLLTANQNVVRADHSVKIPALPADYCGKAEEVASRRAILAGYRTADLLNTLLSPAPQTHKR